MVPITMSKLSPVGGILAHLFNFRPFCLRLFVEILLRICNLCTHVFV